MAEQKTLIVSYATKKRGLVSVFESDRERGMGC